MEATESNEESHFFIIRVTIGREMQALDRLESQLARVKGIYSIIKPYSLKGYLIVEADSRESVSNLIYNIKHIPYIYVYLLLLLLYCLQCFFF